MQISPHATDSHIWKSVTAIGIQTHLPVKAFNAPGTLLRPGLQLHTRITTYWQFLFTTQVERHQANPPSQSLTTPGQRSRLLALV